MEVTVEDILKLKNFKETTLAAGKSGLKRKINNVYFMEVPDIYSYVDPYGLLLTTLFPIANDPQAIEQFIPKLYEQHVSAIAVKPGRYIDEIPQVMIDQANDYDFPLILLPNDANLSLLSNGILEMLLDKQNHVLWFRDKVHSELMELLLKGANLSTLVESLAEMIEAEVILIDQNYHVITSSFAHNAYSITINRLIGFPEQKQQSENQMTIKIGDKVYDGESVQVNPIYVSDECLGFLIALSDRTQSHSNIMVALEQASLLSAILFQREQVILQKERGYLDSFIRDMFNQKFISQLEVAQKAKVFKWDFDLPVVLLNIEVLEKKEEEREKIYTEIVNSRIAEGILAEKLDLSPRKCKLIYFDNSLVCFISVVFENRMSERLKRACDQLILYYQQKFKLGIAISNTVSQFQELTIAHEQTKRTIEISKTLLKGESFVNRYDQLGVYRLIHQVENKKILQEFVNEKIGVILEDADLIHTLASLIRNNYNLQKAAKELFIHYNTMRYRVDKLKELNIYSTDGFELAEIVIAYQIYLFLKSE